MMPRSVAATELTPIEEARRRELDLRTERAELPQRIARASRRVQNLRGEGRRTGDPELEGAVRTVEELVNRQRVLPDLIIDAVAARLELEATALREEDAGIATEEQISREAARIAFSTVQRARRDAARAAGRVQGCEIERERLRQERRPREDFVRKASELSGPKRARLLEVAELDGLLLPFSATRATTASSSPSEEDPSEAVGYEDVS